MNIFSRHMGVMNQKSCRRERTDSTTDKVSMPVFNVLRSLWIDSFIVIHKKHSPFMQVIFG
ncbi:hypothetical protein DOT_1442 [Desulfosporosinus sp. OT]|nr:hypothetical protein DOT_1442 [Desulfosporosinus sp. OT]